MTALCFGLIIGASPLLADPPEITLNGSDAEVSLPDAAGGQSFRVLERSEDFFNWELPVKEVLRSFQHPERLPTSGIRQRDLRIASVQSDLWRISQKWGSTNDKAEAESGHSQASLGSGGNHGK